MGTLPGEIQPAELLSRIAREMGLIRSEMLQFEAMLLAAGDQGVFGQREQQEVQFLDRMIQAVAQVKDVLDRSAGILSVQEKLVPSALFHNLPLRDMSARLSGEMLDPATQKTSGSVDIF